jgi:hypothetical protein
MTSVKEPGFFWSDRQYSRGLEYYSRTFFAGAPAQFARGEATPWYLYSPDAQERILRDLPASSRQFIVLLRDPVARAYSMYQDQVRAGIERLTFIEALDAEASRTSSGFAPAGNPFAHQYLAGGCYAQHLERWFTAAGRDSFLVLRQDHLRHFTADVVSQVFDFLGVEVTGPVPSEPEVDNQAGVARSRRLQQLLTGVARRPALRRTFSAVVPTTVYRPLLERVGTWNRVARAVPPAEPEVLDRLRERLGGEVTRLEELLGWDLAAWRT